MSGGRKFLIYLLSLVLFVSLLGTALSVSARYTIYNSKKIELWLAQSNLYDHFISNAEEQGKKSVGGSDTANVTSISDAAVQEAAKSAFSKQLVQQNINTFIDSNYAWLEGNTSTPVFKIDLADAKSSFAQQVGDYVTKNMKTLPACKDAASTQVASSDPLNATCRPATLSPEVAGAQVAYQIENSDELLANPVLTAQNINPEAGTQKDPYYVKLEQLPKAYQFGKKLPYIFGLLVLLSATVIVLLYDPRRKGWRLVGIVLAIDGLLLVLFKFSSDMTFRQLEDRVFNAASVGELQKSLTTFFHLIESASVKIDFIFGLAFLLIAAIILVAVRMARPQSPQINVPGTVVPTDAPAEKPTTTRDDLSKLKTKRSTAKPATTKPANRKKPPRLVQ